MIEKRNCECKTEESIESLVVFFLDGSFGFGLSLCIQLILQLLDHLFVDGGWGREARENGVSGSLEHIVLFEEILLCACVCVCVLSLHFHT